MSCWLFKWVSVKHMMSMLLYNANSLIRSFCLSRKYCIFIWPIVIADASSGLLNCGGGRIGRYLVCNSFIASFTAECVLIPDSSKFNICSPCIDFTRLNATYACPLLNLFAPFMSTTTFSSVNPWHLCIVTAHARVKGNCVLLIWAPFLFSFWYCPLWRWTGTQPGKFCLYLLDLLAILPTVILSNFTRTVCTTFLSFFQDCLDLTHHTIH